MLTVTIFATIVAEMLPVSNNTPLIGQIQRAIFFSGMFFHSFDQHFSIIKIFKNYLKITMQWSIGQCYSHLIKDCFCPEKKQFVFFYLLFNVFFHPNPHD